MGKRLQWEEGGRGEREDEWVWKNQRRGINRNSTGIQRGGGWGAVRLLGL